MLKYVLFDMDSPEMSMNKKQEDRLNKDHQFRLIKHEIENVRGILPKGKGTELIESKMKSKLITQEETDTLLEDIGCFLQGTRAESIL